MRVAGPAYWGWVPGHSLRTSISKGRGVGLGAAWKVEDGWAMAEGASRPAAVSRVGTLLCHLATSPKLWLKQKRVWPGTCLTICTDLTEHLDRLRWERHAPP